MAGVATTKMSSKGQVVIPENIRKKLRLKTGDQFVVVGDGDVVILKSISPPTLEDFDDLVAKAREAASTEGLTERDIDDAISRVRGRRYEDSIGYKCFDIRYLLCWSTPSYPDSLEKRKI